MICVLQPTHQTLVIEAARKTTSDAESLHFLQNLIPRICCAQLPFHNWRTTSRMKSTSGFWFVPLLPGILLLAILLSKNPDQKSKASKHTSVNYGERTFDASCNSVVTLENWRIRHRSPRDHLVHNFSERARDHPLSESGCFVQVPQHSLVRTLH